MLRCTSCLASAPSWASRSLYRTHTKVSSTASRRQSTFTSSTHREVAREQDGESAKVTRPPFESDAHKSSTSTPSSTSHREGTTGLSDAPASTSPMDHGIRTYQPLLTEGTATSSPSPSHASIPLNHDKLATRTATAQNRAETPIGQHFPQAGASRQRWDPRTKSVTLNRITPIPTPFPGPTSVPIRKHAVRSKARTQDPLPHPLYRPLAAQGVQSPDYDGNANATTHPPAPRPLEVTPTWVHLENLPPTTTKTDIVRAIMSVGATGRIMALMLYDATSPRHPGRVHASVEYDSFLEASALLARAREGALRVLGVAPDVRLQIKEQGPPKPFGPPAARHSVDPPTRVLRIKITLDRAELQGVESIRRFLREKGIDDEVELAWEKPGQQMGTWIVYLRFCCWKYQAAPAIALLRGERGLGVWYSSDPCEVGWDELSAPYESRTLNAERLRVPGSQ